MNRGLAAAVALLTALTIPAYADTITYNTGLTDPPGVYFGTGIPNSGFTVAINNNVEIGLSALERYVAPVVPNGNAYDVDLGDSPHGGSGWGVNFSINLQVGGGTLVLGNIDAVLTVTDTGTGFSQSVPEFLSLLADNTCYGTGGVDAACTNPSDFGVQNSEPGSVALTLGDTGFNDQVPNSYIITLAVYGCDTAGCMTNLLASDTIEVDAVPEPGTLALLGTGFAALGSLRRRRRATAA